MKILFFDLTVNSEDVLAGDITRLNGCIEIDGVTVESFDMLIRPRLAINASDDHELPATAYTKFIVMMDKYVDRFNKKDNFILCCYGSQKAMFLENMFVRNHNPYIKDYFWNPVMDLKILAGFKLKRFRTFLPELSQARVAKYLSVMGEEPIAQLMQLYYKFEADDKPNS